MRRTLLVCTLASSAWSMQVTERERIRELVEAGVMPRKALEDHDRSQAAAADREVLGATLYGQVTVEQMTPDQTALMLAAAERQLERQQARVTEGKRLIAEGVRPSSSLLAELEELDRVRRVHDAARGRARLFEELAAMAKAEVEIEEQFANIAPDRVPLPSDNFFRFEGEGLLSEAQYRYLETAYSREFARPFPVSAHGETDLHRTLGFDHRGRIDVALNPDSKEGGWLRRHLEMFKVPYLAFRGAVRGVSTGAHIHIGPPSQRIRAD